MSKKPYTEELKQSAVADGVISARLLDLCAENGNPGNIQMAKEQVGTKRPLRHWRRRDQ